MNYIMKKNKNKYWKEKNINSSSSGHYYAFDISTPNKKDCYVLADDDFDDLRHSDKIYMDLTIVTEFYESMPQESDTIFLSGLEFDIKSINKMLSIVPLLIQYITPFCSNIWMYEFTITMYDIDKKISIDIFPDMDDFYHSIKQFGFRNSIYEQKDSLTIIMYKNKCYKIMKDSDFNDANSFMCNDFIRDCCIMKHIKNSKGINFILIPIQEFNMHVKLTPKEYNILYHCDSIRLKIFTDENDLDDEEDFADIFEIDACSHIHVPEKVSFLIKTTNAFEILEVLKRNSPLEVLHPIRINMVMEINHKDIEVIIEKEDVSFFSPYMTFKKIASLIG